MKLLESIYQRKSVRNYADQRLPQELLAEINDLISNPDLLYNEVDLNIHLVQEGEQIQEISSGIIGSYGQIEAPHYLVLTSKETTGHLENIGYSGERIVLELTKQGIATCWMGGHVKKDLLSNIIKIEPGYKPVILIALGYPEDKNNLYREDLATISRKEVTEFIVGEVDQTWQQIMEAVQVAPSAVNSQPWRFVVDSDWIHVYVVKRNPLFRLVAKKLERMNYIDVGIAVCHLDIAATEYDQEIEFEKVDWAPVRDDYYIISVKRK